MKDASKHIDLLECLIQDLQERCSTVGCSRDLITIRSRVKHEGFSFLTITLPDFSDTFFTCIEKGFVDSTDFSGWKKSGYLPSFLKGFTNHVFDPNTGRRLDECEVNCIYSVRQICSFFKKVHLDCTQKRIMDSIQKYKRTEDELKRNLFDKRSLDLFRQISRVVISDVFPVRVLEDTLLPHHGPGSTFEKLIGNSKYIPHKFKWYSKLDSCFTRGNVIFPNEEHEYNSATSDDNFCNDEPSVRVIHVPKTLKTPRIIAMEPVVMQMTQQAVKDYVVKRIEANRLTAGHVNFRDQSINQKLALKNSLTRNLATLDLSEASDRVHLELVKQMFSVNPSLLNMVLSTRSGKACIDGETIHLGKFASMGSALCFPVEALCFYNLLLTAMFIGEFGLHGAPSKVSLKMIKHLRRDLYVYGDDLFVPVDKVETVITLLHSFGMKVNKTKSYWLSNFRESCGVDAYMGVNITPIYFRQPLTRQRVNPAIIVSHIETTNQLQVRGLEHTAAFLRKHVECQVGVLPPVKRNSEGLGWVDYTGPEKVRYNRNLQRLEVRTFVPDISRKRDKISGNPALLKCLLKLEQRNVDNKNQHPMSRADALYISALSSDAQHLSYTPVRGALTLKRRWVAR